MAAAPRSTWAMSLVTEYVRGGVQPSGIVLSSWNSTPAIALCQGREHAKQRRGKNSRANLLTCNMNVKRRSLTTCRATRVVCTSAPELPPPEVPAPELQRKVSPAPGPSFWDWAEEMDIEDPKEQELGLKFQSEGTEPEEGGATLSLKFESDSEVEERKTVAEVKAEVKEHEQELEEELLEEPVSWETVEGALVVEKNEEMQTPGRGSSATAASVSNDFSNLTNNIKNSSKTLEDFTKQYETGESFEYDRLVVNEEDAQNAEVQLDIASKGKLSPSCASVSCISRLLI